MQTSTMQRICAVLIMSISLALLPYVAQAAQPETEVDCTGVSEPIPLHYGDHTINCEINPATDLDTFQFIGVDGDQIRIAVFGTSGRFRPRLEVRDPIGTVIKDTWCDQGSFSCSFTVDLPLILSGTYSLAVSDKYSSATGGYIALLTVLKKWTFDLSMPRVASRRHIFEANVHGLTLVLQAHGAKPLDDRAKQTLV